MPSFGCSSKLYNRMGSEDSHAWMWDRLSTFHEWLRSRSDAYPSAAQKVSLAHVTLGLSRWNYWHICFQKSKCGPRSSLCPNSWRIKNHYIGNKLAPSDWTWHWMAPCAPAPRQLQDINKWSSCNHKQWDEPKPGHPILLNRRAQGHLQISSNLILTRKQPWGYSKCCSL